MRTLSSGHSYLLDAIDNGAQQLLVFVKRCGKGYPWNKGKHGGTQTQEVLRVLIDRTLYVDKQIPHPANKEVVKHLRLALLALEERAAERHNLGVHLLIKAGEKLDVMFGKAIEQIPACVQCGHIVCHHKRQ